MNALQKSATVSSLWLATVIGGFLTAQALPTRLQPAQSTMQVADARPLRGNDSDDSTAFWLAMAAVGAGAAMLGMKATPKSRSTSIASPSTTVSLNQTSSKFQHKLLRLLHDDRVAANRLLTNAKLRHPEWSADWCAEKVIYDLERDRH